MLLFILYLLYVGWLFGENINNVIFWEVIMFFMFVGFFFIFMDDVFYVINGCKV